ncbi:hypothetical protein HY522_09460 [bacterium]|nr:hypothetical protein [bacterium]
MKRFLPALVFICLMVSPHPVESAEPIPVRLRVTADLLAVYPDKNYTEFTGHVEALYQGRILRCARLKAFFSKDGKELQRIEAEEKVVLIDKEIEAECARAIFYRDRDVVILSGEPRLMSGESVFRGEIITVNLTTRRLTIEGGVEADIVPPGSKSK